MDIGSPSQRTVYIVTYGAIIVWLVNMVVSGLANSHVLGKTNAEVRGLHLSLCHSVSYWYVRVHCAKKNEAQYTVKGNFTKEPSIRLKEIPIKEPHNISMREKWY